MTILDQLAGCARERTGQAKLRISLEELKQQALSLPKGNFTFEKQLKTRTFFYLRVQKSSPSKGSLLKSFHICRLQRTMKRQGQTASRY